MQHLTADQVIKGASWSLFIKSTPTRIRSFTEQDLVGIGPTFTDREDRVHKVEIGHCLCIGPLGDKWSCSLEDLKRDRYPISLPDHQGFQLYREQHPRPVKVFHVTTSFDLDCQDGEPPLECGEGGYITWNGQVGAGRDLRVVQGPIFTRTYRRYTLLQRCRTSLTPLERELCSLILCLTRCFVTLSALLQKGSLFN